MAVLASFMFRKEKDETLEDYITKRVFADAVSTCAQPDPAGVAGFAAYLARYKSALNAQRAASELK
jgi:hypothetical protein